MRNYDQHDDLSAARGMVRGVLLGTILWTVIFVLILAFMPRKAASAEPNITKEQVDMTYALAWGLVANDLKLAPTQRLVDINAPTIRFVPRSELCTMVGLRPACPVLGWTTTDGDIYMDAALDYSSAENVSILLHEYVHFFQLKARGASPETDCNEWAMREAYAYKVQAGVLAKLPGWGDNPAQQWLEMVYRTLNYQFQSCNRYWIEHFKKSS